MPELVIAIDGPSGSGKSTVSKRVASALGLAYLDTGAIYRAATWWCLDQGVDLEDPAAVLAAVRAMPLEMGVDPAAPGVRVGGTDVAAAIRTEAVTGSVSKVSSNLDVRAELRERQQRAIADEGLPEAFSAGRGIVAEGRDITTVIAPDAHVRVLLTASEEARLARRAAEVHGTADAAAVEATRQFVVQRDKVDSAVTSFLEAADGVVTIDSSELTLEQVVQAVLDLAERRR
ncbi:MAG: (d)CMP kinase [Actinomycetales bacterium]|nr:(d)CMP kinase [Actinomycetales bacterium]